MSQQIESVKMVCRSWGLMQAANSITTLITICLLQHETSPELTGAAPRRDDRLWRCGC